MKKLFLLIIFFYLFYLISSQNCNPRTNCRRRNGRCINDICECNYGFATFLKPNSKQIIYCNYEQIDNWVPFILEIFLPSTGHFYVGNFILGFSKFGLLLIPFITLSIGLCFIIPISDLFCKDVNGFCQLSFTIGIGICFIFGEAKAAITLSVDLDI